jgi:hypothetical protein
MHGMGDVRTPVNTENYLARPTTVTAAIQPSEIIRRLVESPKKVQIDECRSLSKPPCAAPSIGQQT